MDQITTQGPDVPNSYQTRQLEFSRQPANLSRNNPPYQPGSCGLHSSVKLDDSGLWIYKPLCFYYHNHF